MSDFYFYLSPLKTSSIAYLHRLRASIEVDPPYQRQGAVWSIETQQYLIDSIINRFDIPKIYLHQHSKAKEVEGRVVRYSLVDGRQRLEAIWDFLDGKFALSTDFVYLENNSTTAAGLNWTELQEKEDELAAFFAATSLDIIVIQTDNIELIEEMFSRLNEAVPLNAAEKRNGRGGPLRTAVSTVVATPFFSDRLPFANTRYRHYDLATKFLYWSEYEGIPDTKKQRLDDFWEEVRSSQTGWGQSHRVG